MNVKRLLVFACMLAITAMAHAKIVTKEIDYADGETKLRGFLAWDDATDVKRPGVLVCHQWMGLSDHERESARKLARMGYVAFALDMYGVDNRPADRSAAGQLSSRFKNDAALFRTRATAGFELLRKQPMTDAARIAAIGYCFGGTTVLELARSGADLAGVVSFHGGLGTNEPATIDEINAKILVLHGAADPHVPWEEVRGFMNEMHHANADWQFIAYSDAVHAFTQPSAGSDPSGGAAYQREADRRSWEHMTQFFDELFSKRDAPPE